jgi:hypothetical protein
LNRDDGDGAIEEPDDVEKPSRNVFGNDDGAVIVLWVPSLLDIPVLDSPNDVALVGSPQLKLHFISAIAVWVLKQKVEATCVRLPSFFVFQDQVAEPKDSRVVRYPVLDPSLVELSVILQPDTIVLNECHTLLPDSFLSA